MKILQPVLRGILTRQLFTRALEMAFMSFSDKESQNYRAEAEAELVGVGWPHQRHELLVTGA